MLTPRIRRAQRELIEALTEAFIQPGFSVEEAEASMSGIFADVWNEAEIRIRGHVPRGSV